MAQSIQGFALDMGWQLFSQIILGKTIEGERDCPPTLWKIEHG